MRNTTRRAAAITGPVASLGVLLAAASSSAGQSAFATRVLAYDPAPGQVVNSPDFSDPLAALGAPAGGSLSSPDNSKLVTLGGFGGSITLGFDHPIANQPRTPANPQGLDLIVFGNALFVGGDPQRRFAEAGVVEVSADTNGNGRADDPWYVIAGSHLGPNPGALVGTQTWDDRIADPQFPPVTASWIPAGRSGMWTTRGYQLPGAVFGGPVVTNPLGGGPVEGFFGYADCTPTLALGDLDGDGFADDLTLSAEAYYTRPDDPLVVGISAGSGGGDAIDLDWALDPETGLPATLAAIDFVRITTGVNAVHPIFGERSTEISGVAEVRPEPPGAHGADFNGDGFIDPDDLSDYIACYFAAPACARADWNGDGAIDPDDLSDFISVYFAT